MEESILAQVIVWVLSGGGAMVITYFAMDNITFLKELGSKDKRVASIALATVIAVAVFLLGVGMKYYPQPVGLREWVEVLFGVCFPAVGGSQLLHGLTQLKNS